MNAGPLAERRIVVTRNRRQAGTLSAALRELGAEVIELPTIEIVPPDSYGPLDAALRSLHSYDWLIVTSANTVRAIEERLAKTSLTYQALASVKIAAVGSATAEALLAIGATVELVPEQYVAEALVSALRDRISGARVLLARASAARDIIPDELCRLGAVVNVVEAYRTVVPAGAEEAMRAIFATGGDSPDAITFTSSSAARNFFSLLSEAEIDLPPGIKAVSIGPVTSATLREHGWKPAAEANPHDVNGLIAAVVRAIQLPT